MAELVDASDSKSDSARSAGSIPARGTKELSGYNSLAEPSTASPTLSPTAEAQQAGSKPGPRPIATPMILIAITPAAFEAVAATLPLGSVAYEAEANERGRAHRLAGGRHGGSPQCNAAAGRELQRCDRTNREAGGACHPTRVTPNCLLARDRLIPDTSGFSVPASRACPLTEARDRERHVRQKMPNCYFLLPPCCRRCRQPTLPQVSLAVCLLAATTSTTNGASKPAP
jgi:hypothetical protein